MHRDASVSTVKGGIPLNLIYFRSATSFELSALNIVMRFCVEKHGELAFLSPELKIDVSMVDAPCSPDVTGKRRPPQQGSGRTM